MADTEEKRRIAVVSACMNRDGTPAFALTEVEVTGEEAVNGIHYYLVEAELLEAGYEEPFVHFDAGEAPPFLHPAVRQHLGLPPAHTDPIPSTPSEKR
jgi:hypothetical protein